MSELSAFFIEKAEKELGENELRKSQSLAQLRDWMKNHPFIKYNEELDDLYLMSFLRPKKYSMDRVYHSIEDTMIRFKSIPYYENMNEDEIKSFLLTCNKLVKISKNRDADGRKRIIIQGKEIETLNMSANKLLKMLIIALMAGLHQQETQIAGIVLVINCTGMTFDTIKKFINADYLEHISNINLAPIRLKQIYNIGFPSLANSLLEIVIKIIPKKIRQRIHFLNHLEDLEGFLDISELLTDDKKNLNDLNFMKLDEFIMKGFQAYRNISVDFDKVRKFENVGSFRKLEVD